MAYFRIPTFLTFPDRFGTKNAESWTPNQHHQCSISFDEFEFKATVLVFVPFLLRITNQLTCFGSLNRPCIAPGQRFYDICFASAYGKSDNSIQQYPTIGFVQWVSWENPMEPILLVLFFGVGVKAVATRRRRCGRGGVLTSARRRRGGGVMVRGARLAKPWQLWFGSHPKSKHGFA